MEGRPRIVYYLEKLDDSGEFSCPYEDWLEDLQDVRGRGLLEAVHDKFEEGLFGDTRNVGGDVWEHRIHFGPGYRVYYAVEDQESVCIIIAGLKARQQRDIKAAISLWKEYKDARKKDKK